MSYIKDEKKVKGKQRNYVNSNVKTHDESVWGEYDLFGRRIGETHSSYSTIVQLGNLHIDRDFYNPQDTRVYSPKGYCPTLSLSHSPRLLIKDENGYGIRRLTGFESLRLMGLEDEDIQKLVDGGLSNHQLAQLAGNSIVVDVMSSMFTEMIKH